MEIPSLELVVVVEFIQPWSVTSGLHTSCVQRRRSLRGAECREQIPGQHILVDKIPPTPGNSSIRCLALEQCSRPKLSVWLK